MNLSRIRRRTMIMATKGRTAAQKQRAKKKIETILILPGVTRKGNFRTTEMHSLVYPKIKLTSTRQIRPCISDVEGTVTTRLNVS
jgi:hypothetical protein